MHLQYIPLGEVKPRQDDELVTGLNAQQSRRCRRCEFQPGVRRAFISLHGRVLELCQLGADKSNWFNRINGCSHPGILVISKAIARSIHDSTSLYNALYSEL